MRKLLLTAIAMTLLFSCSSDDNKSVPTSEKIEGEWILHSKTVNGEPDDLTACEKQSLLVFYNNQNLLINEYYDSEGECELYVGSATWSTDDGGSVSVHYDGGDTDNFEAAFPNNSTMNLTFQDGPGFEVVTTYKRDQQ